MSIVFLVSPPALESEKKKQIRLILIFQVFSFSSNSMFSSLGKILLSKRNLGYSPAPEYRSLIRFFSTDSIIIPNNKNSFTINYLINSCGFSQLQAQSATKRLNFKSPEKPDRVVTLFRNNGFSDSQISKIITGCPQILQSSVDKCLQPKIQFFNSKGLCGAELSKLMCGRPNLLACSLEKNIIPFYNFVKNVVGTDAKVFTVFKRTMCDVINAKVLASNISLLQDRHVPAPNIAKLLVSQPRVLLKKASRFSEIVDEVEEMKFDPSEYRFLTAVQVLNALSRSSMEAKFDVYRSWGLSSEEVQYAFRMYPKCMLLSEKNIMSKMDYFVNKLGYTPSSIAKQPTALSYSVERIVPRFSVIQVLITNGYLEKFPPLCSLLVMTEDGFFKKYISKFEKEVPELLSTYQATRKMMELDSASFIERPRE